MENIQYTMGHEYIIISQNRIQSRAYKVNKITIGRMSADTGKTLVFSTEAGIKRIRKRTITKMIDISGVSIAQTQFLIDCIKAVLV